MYNKYGNCIDCQQFSPLELDGRCPICENREKEMLLTAQQELRTRPELTRDELAELLQIEISRVEGWIKSGKIRCSALKSRCPQCGFPINSFECEVCKYNTINELKPAIKSQQKKPSTKMYSQRAERFNRKRKRSSSSRHS